MTLMEKFNSRLSSIVKIPELRERIIFTLLMFLVARVGTLIPAPGVDVDRLASMASKSDVLSYINMFSGGAFTRISIFSLGIIPYINASIKKVRDGIKVLGNGELNKKLTVKVHKISKSAQAAIEAKGGTVEIVEVKGFERAESNK